MAVPYTNDGWQEVIGRIEGSIDSLRQGTPFRYPSKETPAFRRCIDHTLLKLDATAAEIDQLCREAWEWDFASVCVRPEWVKRCVDNLTRYPRVADGANVLVASVIGFHEGDYSLEHKLKETTLSLESGANELDIVINWRTLLAKDYVAVHAELAALRAAAPPERAVLKLILETSRLAASDVHAACTIAGLSDFDFVKTSTGFHGSGATTQNVATMRACAEAVVQTVVTGPTSMAAVPPRRKMRVKASGGIRDVNTAVAMLEAGASRLGCSASVQIAKAAGGTKKEFPKDFEVETSVEKVTEDSGY